MELEALRERLAEVDRGIVELAAGRQDLVREVGRAKQRAGRPIRDRVQDEIQSLNEFGRDALAELRRSAAELEAAVAGGDEQRFVQLMERGRGYLDGPQ